MLFRPTSPLMDTQQSQVPTGPSTNRSIELIVEVLIYGRHAAEDPCCARWWRRPASSMPYHRRAAGIFN